MEAFFDEANFAHFFPRLRVYYVNINQRFYWLNVKQLSVRSLVRRLARKKIDKFRCSIRAKFGGEILQLIIGIFI